MNRNGDRDALSSDLSRVTARTSNSAPAPSDGDDDFVAQLTQELRTNLHVMLGFTQLMQRDQRNPLPEAQRLRTSQIVDAGDRLMRLLDDAGVLSRIRSGEVALSTGSVDVLRVLEQVRAELEPTSSSRNLALRIERSPLARPLVEADPWALTEIVRKLMANAIAYCRPEGSVTMHVSAAVPGRVRISIIDTGIGVPGDEQHKLFRPFPHVARSGPSAEGAGLGLATCRALATRMGGSVGFSRGPDRGSEFWLDLPVAAASTELSRPD